MRSMTELAFVGAKELVRSIRRKELSSVEVTEYFLERIEQRNPAVNAVVTLYWFTANATSRLMGV